MDAYDFADRLMEIDKDVWEEMGLESRPSGEVRREYFETILARLDEEGIDPAEIDDDVMAVLEDNNELSLGNALEIFVGNEDIEDAMEREMQQMRW